MNLVSQYANSAVKAVGNNPALIAAPAAAVGVWSIGSRVAAGTLALACKGASKVAEYRGNTEFSEKANNAKDSLINFATNKNNLKTELKTAAFLTIGSAGVFGYSKLIPQPQTSYEMVAEKLYNLWQSIPSIR